MFNIGNFICEDNPGGAPVPVAGITAAIATHRSVHRDTWTLLTRRAGDCLFAMNDAEACWRGWSIRRERGGLARRYRNPMFDLLIACPTCRGSGTDTGLTCVTCDGTGRITVISAGEVN